jgi:hypothetical protein
MEITNDMVRNGVRKASELGLLPRQSIMEDIATNNELMLEILEAAIEVYAEGHDQANGEIHQCLITAQTDQHCLSSARA